MFSNPLAVGTVVRPVVTIAGLDSCRQYRVHHLIQTPFYSLAWLVRADDESWFHVVENAHAVLEVVETRSVTPAAALFN